MKLLGPPISWNFRVITQAPQDVVIGLDLILRFHLHFDPVECRLVRLPSLRRLNNSNHFGDRRQLEPDATTRAYYPSRGTGVGYF